ncbi:hypothetical protein QR680_008451 [Steinernema hermaphroditum]|uniref:Ras-related protein Rab-1 n=1 Tax=Steinernema hermaphroditum TaxID=289476 RepID=A0AA39IGN3_9BILA|nr:hypothetical protein QR680_008451 [Steinernema hermaphroditum]
MARKYYDHLFKVLLIGDTAVGKTSLLQRFADDSFSPSLNSTIGIDFKIKTVLIGGKKVKLQIWDTAGQERFDTITTSYYRGSHAILLVYDITNPYSFQNLEKWLRYINQYADDEVQKVIIGNKCDMVAERSVPKEMGERTAQNYSISFLETSAKANINVDRAFFDITERLLEQVSTKSPIDGVKIPKSRKTKKAKCC